MSLVPSEAIYAALFSLGKAISWTWNAQPQQWAYSSRHLEDWKSSRPQPALYQRQMLARPTQNRSQGGGFGLAKWPLYVQWFVYLQAANPSGEGAIYPSTYMNTVLDAIVLALQPKAVSAIQAARGLPGEGQTLAGFNGGVPLVENVWIDGEVLFKDSIDSDTQLVIRIPITISTAI